MTARLSWAERLGALSPPDRAAAIAAMTEEQLDELRFEWEFWRREEQTPPAGDWRVWLYLAGRGSGKTRTGAEFVRASVKAGCRRIALVAPTAADARDVMVEGESGILGVSPPATRPIYELSKRRVTWRNRAIATTYSADEPERLRGPQHDAAWCDEVAAWRYPEAWDMLMFGLRLGKNPRVMVERLMKAVEHVTADHSLHTPDLGGKATTKQVTDAVCEAQWQAND